MAKEEQIVDKVKATAHWGSIIGSAIFSIITATIMVYAGYTEILTSIDNNNKSISANTASMELTQMMILKSIVKESDNNPCAVSDNDWDDYIENYSTLRNLKIKYKKMSADKKFKLTARLIEDSPECKK